MLSKKKFIKKYRISDSLPLYSEAKLLSAGAFVEAISEFLANNFRGCVSIGRSEFIDEHIMVCGDYAAYLLRLIISGVYGRELLHIEFSSDNDAMHIEIRADGHLPLSGDEMREIIKASRNAGIEIRPDVCSIFLTIKYHPALAQRVYAISPADGKSYVFGKLAELLCIPAPCVRDENK